MQYVKMFLKRKFETLWDCETPVSKFKTSRHKITWKWDFETDHNCFSDFFDIGLKFSKTHVFEESFF